MVCPSARIERCFWLFLLYAFPFLFFYSPKVLAFFRQAVLAISFFQGTLWCSASFLRGFFVTHAIITMAVRLPGICPIAGAKVIPFFYARKFFTRFFSRPPVFFVKPFFNFHTLTNGWQRYGELTALATFLRQNFGYFTVTRGMASISRCVYDDCG